MATAFIDLQLTVIAADRGSGGTQIETVFAAIGGSISLPVVRDVGGVLVGLQPATLLVGNMVILLRHRLLVGSLVLAVAQTVVMAAAVVGGAIFVSGIVPEAADAFGLAGFAAPSTRSLAGMGAYAFSILALGQLQRLGRWLDNLR